MSRRPIDVQVSREDQKALRAILRAGIQQVRVVLRALALSQLTAGQTAPVVARIVHLSPQAVRRIAPVILGMPVHVPTPAEYVALGAARQAAWTLSGADAPPSWSVGTTVTYTGEPTPEVVERYHSVRTLTEGQ